jgi:alpha-methylacyl-CoA racemase
MSGPLTGVRIVEMAGIGPLPMAAMLLADLGATVLRIDRLVPSGLGIQRPKRFNLVNRSRQSVAVDLKSPEGLKVVLDLVAGADALIEGFRPKTMERLGLGPSECFARNPRLVYGRMTGWGQEGPLAATAGHDLNYLALTGALHAIGRKDQPPTPPLNLVADYGGGAMYLTFGILAGIIEARSSGQGQVVDAAMIDGVSSLMTSFYGLKAAGLHHEERGNNILDSGAPYYEVYRCADGGYMSVAAIEPKFRIELLALLGLKDNQLPDLDDRASWAAAKKIIADRFMSESRAHWEKVFEGSDACVAPVLTMSEAPEHPHMLVRNSFLDIGGVVQPAPAPRFSRTKAATPTPADAIGLGDAAVLSAWGIPRERIALLQDAGVLSPLRTASPPPSGDA